MLIKFILLFTLWADVKKKLGLFGQKQGHFKAFYLIFTDILAREVSLDVSTCGSISNMSAAFFFSGLTQIRGIWNC